jgi:hypothetical protein
MSFDFKCEDRLKLGFLLRIIVTIILLSSIKLFPGERKHMLLLIVIKLIILDSIDSLPALFYNANIKSCWNPCTMLNYYQIRDKLTDILSYFLIYIILDYDPYLLTLILWRFLGVFLFTKTKNRSWLVPFFDFVKEYLVYLYFFGYDFKYIAIFFLGKIGFEYYFHVFRLSNNLCLKRSSRS